MRKHWLSCAILVLAGCSASAAGCLAWPRDHVRFMESTVYFQSGSSIVKAEAKPNIAEVANYLKAHPETAVSVEGHCDYRGSVEHNRWLGDRRARAIAKELVRVGIAEERIDTISYGKDRPVASERSTDASQKNRRVEFVLLTPPKP